MNADATRLWERALSIAQQEVLRPSFETWLRNTQPISLDDHTLVVAVPNQFARNWVQQKYSATLQHTLSELTGGPMELQFVVGPSTGTPDPLSYSLFEEDEGAIGASPDHSDLEGDSSFPTHSLNPKYTFNAFVVGNSNRLAYAASRAVAEAPARAYNPLFVYGGVGLGKTHLMQGIAHEVLRQHPNRRVVYISSETFANELINAIADRTTVDFRNRYRNVDVLLVDDIQFLAGKERTQEEFFHTFNALHQSERQIVLSSDKPPKEIPTLEERLRSRFAWGLIADIQSPDLETRIAILQKKAAAELVTLPESVLYYIAQNISTNIRDLEAALVRLLAYSSLVGAEIDQDLTEEALAPHLLNSHQIRPLTINQIQETVASHFDMSLRDFKSRKRTRAIAFPRQIAMYLCRQLTDASLPAIGEEFGGRDHSTVIHACEKIDKEIRDNPDLEATIEHLKHSIKAG